jgi:hypothetical protein
MLHLRTAPPLPLEEPYLAWLRDYSKISLKAPELHRCWKCADMKKPVDMDAVDLPSMETLMNTIKKSEPIAESYGRILRRPSNYCVCWPGSGCGHQQCFEIWKELRSCLEGGPCSNKHVISCSKVREIREMDEFHFMQRRERNLVLLKEEMSQWSLGSTLIKVWRSRVPALHSSQKLADLQVDDLSE